ncbi:MAG: orotate phosphoribosyltransferase [Bacillota bacterium]|jgi:orotate phosphoribosyltransferase
MGYKEEFIEFMVRANALCFGDFTAKSGRKTPYFINAGNYQIGEHLAKLGDFYAAAIMANRVKEYDLLFGPAYKGIPLAVTTAVSLYRNHQINAPYSFNRKEAKDHGEGGMLVGYQPQDGDRVLIIEDVITAGTAVRESLALLGRIARVKITALVIAVDRMEKGSGNRGALQELRDDYGIETYAIVNIQDIVRYLFGREIDGKVVLDAQRKQQIETYLSLYGC